MYWARACEQRISEFMIRGSIRFLAEDKFGFGDLAQLNASVINEMSQMFATGYVCQDVGIPVRRAIQFSHAFKTSGLL